LHCAFGESGSPPKADIVSLPQYVSFVPIATERAVQHLVGAAGKWQRIGDAGRFGGLEIDVKLDFGYLLDR
jgi:hypothetical protein